MQEIFGISYDIFENNHTIVNFYVNFTINFKCEKIALGRFENELFENRFFYKLYFIQSIKNFTCRENTNRVPVENLDLFRIDSEILDYIYYDPALKDFANCEIEIKFNIFRDRQYYFEDLIINKIDCEYFFNIFMKDRIYSGKINFENILLPRTFLEDDYYFTNLKNIPACLYHKYEQLTYNFDLNFDINTLCGNMGKLHWKFCGLEYPFITKSKVENIILLEKTGRVPIHHLVKFGGISMSFSKSLMLQDIISKLNINHAEYKKIFKELFVLFLNTERNLSININPPNLLIIITEIKHIYSNYMQYFCEKYRTLQYDYLSHIGYA